METRKEKIIKYKTVTIEDGVKMETVFIAFDGKEFKSKDACKNYEETKLYYEKLSKIKQKTFNFKTLDELEFPLKWYFVSNEDELEIVLKELMYYDQYQKVTLNNKYNFTTETVDKKFFELNQWYSHIYNDGGDYQADSKFYTFEFFRKELDEFLNSFSD